MTRHRASKALAHLGEIDPALAILALWCDHMDGSERTFTSGSRIEYGLDFKALAISEQVGLVAHHVLHVALRHTERQSDFKQRFGASFDENLFGLAADAIVNETLLLAEHSLPRPCVTLSELLSQAGLPAASPIEALSTWDVERLVLRLQADEKVRKKLKAWGRERGFSRDLRPASSESGDEKQSAADWRNQMLRALQAGQKAGSGLGMLGTVLADLPQPRVPWEVHLRGLLARALSERPHRTHRRPASQWLALLDHAQRTRTPEPAFQPGVARMDVRPKAVVGLDCSSSVSAEMLKLFSTEIVGIARRSNAEVTLLAFDTTVYEERQMDKHHPAPFSKLDLRTGGGTDFNELFLRAEHLSPSILVVLTDLDAPLPERPNFPVIWAVPHRVEEPKFGRLLRLDH